MNSIAKNQRWVICPFCNRPNLFGRMFCKYCWSPRLSSGKVINTEEMQRIVVKQAANARRWHIFKIAVVSLCYASLAIAFMLFILFNFTDVLIRPDQAITSSSSPGNWTMFRHNFTYSGGITDTSPRGEIQWTFRTGASIQSSPAVVNDTVYFGARDGKLYAVHAAGNIRWEFQTGSWVDSSPVVADGVLYVGSNDGSLYALDTKTGKQIWIFKTRYPVKTAPAVAGGLVYFGSTDGILYGLDAVTGEKRWQFNSQAWIEDTSIIANGIVYLGVNNALYALDARNGRVRLHFQSYSLVSSSPGVDSTGVYFGTMAGILYAVDGNARNWPLEHRLRPYWLNLWLFGVPVPKPTAQSGSMWGIDLGNAINSSPAVVNNTTYLGVGNDIAAVATSNGEQLWRFKTSGPVKSSPIISGGSVYFGSDDGRIYALDAASGNKLWDIATGGPVESTPAISDGILYVGSYDGSLYAVK